MRTCKSVVVALAVLALEALPASAQDAKNVEVTPYVAVGSSGASPIGAALTVPLTSTLNIETDVAYRRGEGRMHALSSSTSLLFDLPRLGETTPYVAAGLGLSQYGTLVFSPDGRPVGTQPRLAFTVNAGGGLKMPMRKTLDLRTDARWSKSLGRDGFEQFRVAQGIGFDIGKR